jgi:AraC-like DNA-binding protein
MTQAAERGVPEQRLGVGAALPGLLGEFGVDPAAVFAAAGLDAAMLDPGQRVAFPNLLRLLDSAVTATGCEHLGLLCGLRFELQHHGAIGALMRSAATLGEALEDFVTWQPGHSSGAIVYLHRAGPDVAFGYGLHTEGSPGAWPLYDAVVGVGLRLVRLLTRDSVGPVEVQLCHAVPRNPGAYRRLLRAPVRFNQDRACLILDQAALHAPLPEADPLARRDLLAALSQQARTTAPQITVRVRHELRRAMLSGPPRMPAIADRLGLNARTLRRRLAAEGTSFERLSGEVRFAVARELLDITDLPVGDIALVVGSASPAVFSDTFRHWAGLSPVAWRRQRRARPRQG